MSEGAERFQIIRELGRGGMGTVYLARDANLGREVALKLLGADHAGAQARFEREGQLAAALSHPGIVRVHGAGLLRGRPFIAFELVQGARELDAACAPLDLEQRAALVRDAARALAHAHERGVIHRDLKPANLLVDGDGHVRVTDFGVAAAAGLERLTRTGALVGTPTYMSPEQLSGQREQVGPHSDVWALGAILYELLTGETVRKEESLQRLIDSGLRLPQRPDALNPEVSPQLSAVCLRALAPTVDRRYPHAGELADDLDRALQGEPVLAARNAGRRPLLLVIPLAIALTLAGVLASFREDTADGRDHANPPSAAGDVVPVPSPSDARQDRDVPSTFEHPLALAIAEGKRTRLLKRHGRPDYRSWFHAFGVGVLNDGRLVTGSGRWALSVWTPDGSGLDQRLVTRGSILDLSLLPDQRALSVGRSGELRLWDLSARNPEPVERWDLGVGQLEQVAVARDRPLATVVDSKQRDLHVFDLEAGKLLRTVRIDLEFHSHALSPSGRRALIAGTNGTLLGVSTDAAPSWTVPDVHAAGVRGVAFLDEDTVASSDDETLAVWTWGSTEPSRSARAETPLGRIVRTPSGELLVATRDPPRLQRWSVALKKLSESPSFERGRVKFLGCSPNGRWAAAGTATGFARWDLQTGDLLAPDSEAHGAHIAALAVTADGRIASGGQAGGVLVRTRPPGSLRSHRLGHPVAAIAWRDGRLLTALTSGTVVELSDEGRKELRPPVGEGQWDSVKDFAFAGRWALWATHDGALELGLLEEDALPRRLWAREGQAIDRVAITPDGERAVFATYRNDGVETSLNFKRETEATLRLFDVWNGKELWSLPKAHQGSVMNIALTKDGTLCATSSFGGEVKVWDMRRDGALLWSKTTEHTHTYGSAFDPAGEFLVTTTDHGDLFLYAARSGEELDALLFRADADCDAPFSVTFSPDGERLYVGTVRGVVYEFAITR